MHGATSSSHDSYPFPSLHDLWQDYDDDNDDEESRNGQFSYSTRSFAAAGSRCVLQQRVQTHAHLTKSKPYRIPKPKPKTRT